MTTVFRWRPITDVPEDPRGLTDGELESLLRVWQNQKDELIERASLEEFDKRLRREWAIETGIIEDVYTLDRGVTRTLIEKGIDAAFITKDSTNRDTTLVARIIQDHYDALEGMFDFVAGRRPLSTSYTKELHAALLRNVDTHVVQDQFGQVFEKRLEKGQYKTDPNSPTGRDGSLHQYCSPEHVASEMDGLIRMHLEHESRNVPPEVAAAWLHHRFTQIHPFADGNGRVARALASLVFIRAGWFPLVVKRDDRVRYIEALEKADVGDLRPLVSLFVEVQRNLLISATEIGYDVRPITSAHDAVIAARDRLIQRGTLPRKDWLAAKEVAAKLANDAVTRLDHVSGELQAEIGTIGAGFNFYVLHGLEYEAPGPVPQEYKEYGDAVRLNLHTGQPRALVLSFRPIGLRFRGLIGVQAYLTDQVSAPTVIAGGAFQINYAEDLESATKRFTPWLDRVIVEGLNTWRLTL